MARPHWHRSQSRQKVAVDFLSTSTLAPVWTRLKTALQQSDTVGVDRRAASDNDTETELCHLPSDSGSCDEHIAAYFYDPMSRRCERFVWSGCGGNSNRFWSLSECEQRCIYLETVSPNTHSTQLTTAVPPGGKT